jgi:hypothetical protein
VAPPAAGALPSVRISPIRPFSMSTDAPSTALGWTQSMSVTLVRRVRIGFIVKGLADNVCSNACRQFALLTGHGNFPSFLQQIVESPGLLGNQMGSGR